MERHGAGAPDQAGILLGMAGRVWPSVGFPMFGAKYYGAPHQHCEAATRQAIGDHEFEAAFRCGMAYNLDDAVAYALGEPIESAASPGLAAGKPSPLTPRERQVADLIAEGLSNKEIGARLVIAQRTAEGHVERILIKLGFTNRVQLASWVTEQRT